MDGEAIPHRPSIADLLADPTTSFALRCVLQDWRDRDPVDAANDAACLVTAFDLRVQEVVSCSV